MYTDEVGIVNWLGPGGRLLRNPSIRLNVLAPIAAYWLLSKAGVNTVGALATSAVFPAAGSVLAMTRRRRLDPLAALALGAIAVGLAAALVFHSGRLLVVRESLITGTLGVAFLGSLVGSRPMTTVLRRRLSPSGAASRDRAETATPGTAAQLRAETAGTATRDRAETTILGGASRDRAETATWGVALVAESALRVGLSYLVPTGVMVTISPLVAPIVLGPVALWTLRRRPAWPKAPAAPLLANAGR